MLITRLGAASLAGWPLWASMGVHAVGIAAVASSIAWTPALREPDPAPIEVVTAPAVLQETPRPARRELPTPPRLASRPEPARREVAIPTLLGPAPRGESAPARAEPAGTGQLPVGPDASSWAIPGAGASGGKGTGKLLSTGDLALPDAREGGGGQRGRGALASTGDTAGLTSLAHPLGGYQTKPRYPDSARRQGIEGESVLRLQVLKSGRVGAIAVARSAGFPDLDRAAMDAVKTWVFEPARRGEEAVDVWVTLPVRFHLHSGLVE